MPEAYTLFDESGGEDVPIVHAPVTTEGLKAIPWRGRLWAAPGPEFKTVPRSDDAFYSYSPMLRAKEELGDHDFRLPESIYGAVIAAVISSSNLAERVAFVGSAVFGLFASYVAQVAFISYLQNVLVTPDEDNIMSNCEGGDPWLRTLAVTAFSSLVLKDFTQTWNMHVWLSFFPSCSQHEALLVQRFQYARPMMYAGRVYRPVSGLTLGERCFFYVCILAGKALLAVYIGYVGAGVVLRSKDDFGLVMNSLAAGFVLELDDFSFKFFMPSTLRVALTSVIERPFGRAGEEAGLLVTMLNLFYTILVSLSLAVAVALFYTAWC